MLITDSAAPEIVPEKKCVWLNDQSPIFIWPNLQPKAEWWQLRVIIKADISQYYVPKILCILF